MGCPAQALGPHEAIPHSPASDPAFRRKRSRPPPQARLSARAPFYSRKSVLKLQGQRKMTQRSRKKPSLLNDNCRRFATIPCGLVKSCGYTSDAGGINTGPQGFERFTSARPLQRTDAREHATYLRADSRPVPASFVHESPPEPWCRHAKATSFLSFGLRRQSVHHRDRDVCSPAAGHGSKVCCRLAGIPVPRKNAQGGLVNSPRGGTLNRVRI
jgi:hypothetical protein